MRLLAVLLADEARISDNKLDIQGGAWEWYAVESFPGTVDAALALVFEFEEADSRDTSAIQLLVADPNDVVVLETHALAAFPSRQPLIQGAPLINHVAPRISFPVESPGVYQLAVLLEGRELAILRIAVLPAQSTSS